MSIKFKLFGFADDPIWIGFKLDYVPKTTSEIAEAESFMLGVMQGICSVTGNCEKIRYVDDCSIALEGFTLSIPVMEDPECSLDDLQVEIELNEEYS